MVFACIIRELLLTYLAARVVNWSIEANVGDTSVSQNDAIEESKPIYYSLDKASMDSSSSDDDAYRPTVQESHAAMCRSCYPFAFKVIVCTCADNPYW